jgi:hypothetical protein
MSPVQVAVGNRALTSEGGGRQRPRDEEIWGEARDQVVDILSAGFERVDVFNYLWSDHR